MSNHDSLASRLEDSVCLDEVENGVTLLGALIADVVPNIGGIKGSLKTSWKEIGNFKLVHLHRNIFSIKVSREGASLLLNGGPWHVDNMRFNVVEWLPQLTVHDVHFNMVWYWVQIRGLTKEKMNSRNAKLIGAEFGKVLEVEDLDEDDAVLRGYLRVKVLLDSRNPLPTGFWLPLNEFTRTRVEYAYEGLCDFCYTCGRLGHHMDSCSDRRLLSPERRWTVRTYPEFHPETRKEGKRPTHPRSSLVAVEINGCRQGQRRLLRHTGSKWRHPQGLLASQRNGDCTGLVSHRTSSEERAATESAVAFEPSCAAVDGC
ncbi:hypothetical protein ACLB2K_022109 [Fragaria x ananassa]